MFGMQVEPLLQVVPAQQGWLAAPQGTQTPLLQVVPDWQSALELQPQVPPLAGAQPAEQQIWPFAVAQIEDPAGQQA